MFKKFLINNFFSLFYFLKLLNYSFFSKTINNSHFYLRDLKIMTKDVLSYTNDDPVILDIGSHIGNEAQLILHYFSKAKIHCFEPVPRVFLKLSERFKNNKNISCNKVFMTNCIKKNYSVMCVNDKTDLIGSYYKKTDVTKTTNKRIQVPNETVDNFIKRKKLSKIYLLRVDVNGYEKNVLQGASLSLEQKKIDFIHFAFFNVITKLEGGDLHEVSKYLIKKNYRMVSFYNNFFHSQGNGGYYFATFIRNDF